MTYPKNLIKYNTNSPLIFGHGIWVGISIIVDEYKFSHIHIFFLKIISTDYNCRIFLCQQQIFNPVKFLIRFFYKIDGNISSKSAFIGDAP